MSALLWGMRIWEVFPLVHQNSFGYFQNFERVARAHDALSAVSVGSEKGIGGVEENAREGEAGDEVWCSEGVFHKNLDEASWKFRRSRYRGVGIEEQTEMKLIISICITECDKVCVPLYV